MMFMYTPCDVQTLRCITWHYRTRYSRTVTRVLSRDRPLLLALWALSLNGLSVLYAVSMFDYANHQTTVARLLLLRDTLEHTLVEPCMSTFFDQKASEGLWICFVRHLETP